MTAVALVQKPYDVMNLLEFRHQHAATCVGVEVIVIGNHSNALAARRLCDQFGLTYLTLPDPDLYSEVVGAMTAKRVPAWLQFCVKPALLVPAFFWWHVVALSVWIWFRFLRPAYDLVLLDAWRSKCVFLPALRGRRHALLDGGFSTVSYGLSAAFEVGGAHGMIEASLRQQKVHLPWWLRRWVLSHVEPQATFFTCYAENFSRPSVPGVEFNVYDFSRSAAQRKPCDGTALILGIPKLKHIDAYIEAALDGLAAAGQPREIDRVKYRFHPQDRNRAGLDAGYRREVESGVQARGLAFSYPEHGVEFDFLSMETLPRLIVTYDSSSTVWLQQVYGAQIELKLLALR